MAKIEDVNAAIDRLEAAAARNEDTTEAIRDFVQGLKDQITALAEQIANSGNEASFDEAVNRLKGLADRLDADTAAEAIVSGTEHDEPTGGVPAEEE